GAAGLRHVGPPAAALAAERLGALAHELDRVEPVGEIGGDADNYAGLAVGRYARYHDDTRPESLFAFISKATKVFGVNVGHLSIQFDVAHRPHWPQVGVRISCAVRRRGAHHKL